MLGHYSGKVLASFLIDCYEVWEEMSDGCRAIVKSLANPICWVEEIKDMSRTDTSGGAMLHAQEENGDGSLASQEKDSVRLGQLQDAGCP